MYATAAWIYLFYVINPTMFVYANTTKVGLYANVFCLVRMYVPRIPLDYQQKGKIN